MISNKIQREIKRRIPGIMESYGGLNNFLSYVREFLHIPYALKELALNSYSKSAFYNYLNLLITYSNDIIVISPWGLFFDLRNSNIDSTISKTSININEPYKVYTLEGDLIYTVKSHLGVFGESKLDKQLIVNSSNASAYYLKFKTYNGGEKVKLLLVNLYSQNTVVSNQFFRRPPSIQTSTLSFVNNTSLDIELYFIPSSIISNPSFNFQQEQYLNIIKPNDIKIFNVEQSAYFFINQNINYERTIITNPLNDLVFQTLNSRLLFVGTNVDVFTLNKLFNKGIQYSNKPIQDVITLNANI